MVHPYTVAFITHYFGIDDHVHHKMEWAGEQPIPQIVPVFVVSQTITRASVMHDLSNAECLKHGWTLSLTFSHVSLRVITEVTYIIAGIFKTNERITRFPTNPYLAPTLSKWRHWDKMVENPQQCVALHSWHGRWFKDVFRVLVFSAMLWEGRPPLGLCVLFQYLDMSLPVRQTCRKPVCARPRMLP